MNRHDTTGRSRPRPAGWIVIAVLACVALWPLSRASAAPRHPGPDPVQLQVGATEDPVTVHLGASVWLRAEDREPDHRFSVPQRTRVETGIRWRGLHGFVQLQDVRDWGTAEPTTSTPATTGLHQGYLELSGSRGDAEGFIRVGRQEHALGTMRLMGTAPWNPHMRSLDAIRVHGSEGPFAIDLLGALLRPPTTFDFEAEDGTHRIHAPAEGLLTAAFEVELHRAATVEIVTIARNYAPTVDAPSRDRLVVSPGARIHGNPWRGLGYDLEGYLQTGRWDHQGQVAWLGAATLGYRWERGPRPLLEAGYTLATGSGCEVEGETVRCDRGPHRDFDGLLGARHRFLGIVDMFAPTNVHDAWAGLRLEPWGWTELRLEAHHFMLHDPRGVWLRTNGTPVGATPDPGNRERTVGEELDLRVSLHPWGPLKIGAGYGVFVPTVAGPRLVGETPQQLAYLMTALEF